MTRADLDKAPVDVAAMFDDVAERYDLTNDVLALGQTRRWRTAVWKGGKWLNQVAATDAPDAIENHDLDAISARPDRFDEILVSGSPEEQLATIQQRIGLAREHLRKYPASCSARASREAAFTELRDLAPRIGKTADQVEAENRLLEDYVYADLTYAASKTCCWNSTNDKMAQIVLDYATKEQARADVQRVCKLTVFKNGAGGKPNYDLFKQHAAGLGRAADWKEWTEDERCEQRAVAEDALTTAAKANQCL